MALYRIETHGELDGPLAQEWLLTNGIGGFASSTVVGCNTRRYHGLLCAATNPPVGRIMMLSRIGEILLLDGKSEMLELSVNQFREHVHPRGDRYLRSFELDDTARWEYLVEGVRVVKEVQVLWRNNVAGIRYTVIPDRPRQVQLQLLPFVSLRDFHALRHGMSASMRVQSDDAAHVSVASTKWTLHMQCDAGRFIGKDDWWRGHVYAVESERGLDDVEELFNPGRFVMETDREATITIWASTERISRPDWAGEIERRRAARPVAASSTAIQRLTRAADDFIVSRKTPEGKEGTTILAGYPWFADWGRDTMIALPGLLLTTKRFEQARDVLTLYAQYVSDGMIPNRFDDYTNEPSYNTVDASLWFIHAAHEYRRLAGDEATFRQRLLPACRAIVDGYRRGTRFGICMDESDALITQGDEHTQLTWMDAKCDGIAFTPRQGKAVEINALWYHALVLLGEMQLALRVKSSFKGFWISPFRGLCDVITDGRRDTSLRPNQIFTVSLPNSPLDREHQLAVVETVRRELLTPFGLRTLSPSDPRFQKDYRGPQRQRDQAYHNGTIWPWLIGAFLEAYLRVHEHSPEAIQQCRQWLAPLIGEFEHGCVGQISEIYEAAEPHRSVGCFAQAWSVAEVLRLAAMLEM